MGQHPNLNADITKRSVTDDGPGSGSSTGGLTAEQERLVIEHLTLATRLAAGRLRRVPDVWRGDIRSAALEGLMQAARNFDPRHGFTFSTFAAWRIRGAMSDELRRLHLGRATKKGNNWKDRSRDRSIEALAEAASRDGAAADHLGFLAVAEADPAAVVETDAELRLASDLIRQLHRDDQQLLEMLFVRNLTLADVGRLVGVTESRISQRMKALKQRLRRLAAEYELASA